MKIFILSIVCFILLFANENLANDNPTIKSQYDFVRTARYYKSSYYSKAIKMPAEETLCVYDSKGNLLSSVNSYYRDNYPKNEWILSSKNIFTYDSKSNILTKEYYYYNSQNNNWDIQRRNIYTYDDKNNMLSDEYYEENNGSLENNYKYRYKYNYNAKDSLILESQESYNKYNDEWRLDYRDIYEFTYDSKGNELTKLRNNYTINGYKRYKEEYTYNSNGKRIQTLYTEFRNSVFNAVNKIIIGYVNNIKVTDTLELYKYNGQYSVIDTKTINNYESNGKIKATIIESWENNNLLKSTKTEYKYDVDGNVVNEFNYYANYKGSFLNFSRYTSTFNSNKQVESLLYEVWKDNAWENAEQYNHFYNKANNEDSLLFQIWANNNWRLAVKRVNVYNNDNLIIKQYCVQGDSNYNYYDNYGIYFKDKHNHTFSWYGSSVDVYYEDLLSIINNDKEITYQCSPNPAKNEINLPEIENENVIVDVFNLQGEHIVSQTGKYKLNIETLKPSTYFIKLKIRDKYYYSKFIKE